MKDGKYESLEEFAEKASKDLRERFINEFRIKSLSGRTVTHENIESNAARTDRPYSFHFVENSTAGFSKFLGTKNVEEIRDLFDKYDLDTDVLFPAFSIRGRYINVSPFTYVVNSNRKGFDKVADYLIRRGANVNLVHKMIGDDDNWANNGANNGGNNANIPVSRLTPLMVAVFRKEYRGVKYLIEHGAKVTVGNLDAFEFAKDILPDNHRIVRYLDIKSRGRNVSALHNVFSRKNRRLPENVLGHIGEQLTNRRGYTDKILAGLKNSRGSSGGGRTRRQRRR
jgi:hypothetical protein